MKANEIKDVTDTALWVAAYRAQETNRPDALFKDPYAQMLIGELGTSLATRTQGSRYTAWSVIVRTFIIDNFIYSLINNHNINTIINLGAGLDTRPYRMRFNAKITWIEVDFENIISLKNKKLINEIPKCHLERISLDLSDNFKRDLFLSSIAKRSDDILIITEGVIPYLTNADASNLASALKSYPQFKYWITEYYSPEILKFLRTPKRLKQMEKAPFLFYPDHWFDFFKTLGWHKEVTKYFGVESEFIGRTPPVPGWIKNDPNPIQKLEEIKYYLGYTIYKNEN